MTERRPVPYAVAPSVGHIKSLLRNQDRERGGVRGVVGFGVQMSGAYFSSRDAARRLEGCCFSVSESAA